MYVEKCIIYCQLRDFTIFFAHDEFFSKTHKINKKQFLGQNKKMCCV
jgi:hypothetical protein